MFPKKNDLFSQGLASRIAGAIKRVLGRMREVWGFRALMTALLVLTVTAVSGFVLLTTNKFVAESKLRDVWSILFLELEQRAADLSKQLLDPNQTSKDEKSIDRNSSIYALEIPNGKLTWVRGRSLKVKSLRDFGITSASDLVDWNLLDFENQHYILRKSSSNLITITPFSATLQLPGANDASDHSLIYAATRQGLLVYRNSEEVHEVDYRSRPLVQKFIALSVWQGQVELIDARERAVYGFFNEVPGTNLVIFAETLKSAVTDAVDNMTRKLFVIVLIALGIAVFILQIPLISLLRPVGALVVMTKKVADGDFHARVGAEGIGEIATLSRAFTEMTSALRTREETIQKLMIEQQEKVRLDGEMKTAHIVQENFFPVDEMNIGNIEVRGYFASANKCGGDWWGGINVCGKLLLFIGDATGHGVPSALITAATHSCAITLEQILPSLPPEKINASFIAGILNNAVCKAGRGTIKMTFFLSIIDPENGTMEYVNASHEPPLIYRQPPDQAMFSEGTKNNLESVEGKPDPTFGASLTSLYHAHSTVIGPGDVVIWYTDGITEARDPTAKEFGEGRLCRTFLKVAGRQPGDIRQYITTKVTEFCAGRPHDDDVTLVVLKRKNLIPPT